MSEEAARVLICASIYRTSHAGRHRPPAGGCGPKARSEDRGWKEKRTCSSSARRSWRWGWVPSTSWPTGELWLGAVGPAWDVTLRDGPPLVSDRRAHRGLSPLGLLKSWSSFSRHPPVDRAPALEA